MEVKKIIESTFWEGGGETYKKSPEYLQMMVEIEKEISQKYIDLLVKEQRFFSRLLLKVQREITIYNRKKALRGFQNFYLARF